VVFLIALSFLVSIYQVPPSSFQWDWGYGVSGDVFGFLRLFIRTEVDPRKGRFLIARYRSIKGAFFPLTKHSSPSSYFSKGGPLPNKINFFEEADRFSDRSLSDDDSRTFFSHNVSAGSSHWYFQFADQF